MVSSINVLFLIYQSYNKYTMILSNTAVDRISERKILLALALELGFSEQWTRRLIEANKDNGPLTTHVSVRLIKEETGLTENEILTEAAKEVTTNEG